MPLGENGQEIGEELCPECGGRGWILEPDGGAGRAKKCFCRQAVVVPRLLEKAGIPERYQNCRLSNFKTGPDEKGSRVGAALVQCERFTGSFVAKNTESGLLLYGPPGVGKTHLAAAVLTELIREHRVRGLFVDFTSLIHRIQSTFDPSSQESKQTVLDPLSHAEVLVLDELGAQKPTEWVRETLYLIVNSRYMSRLPTIFTTNYELQRRPKPGSWSVERPLDRGADDDFGRGRGSTSTPELLVERIGANLVSRLYQMAKPVEMRAEDFRRTVKVYGHPF